ncbi:uncharacterized protein LOC131018617 [Salvia miltiorrhiza]|uniref:uncharacterized protein LOC131018617 n=1 Tax=Salvia miltiorrhiza TaxID=226208 RepID=UPI0025AC0F26|nr:uncharacterized protein LOC131018617 [Salvia miltiorrhiza]
MSAPPSTRPPAGNSRRSTTSLSAPPKSNVQQTTSNPSTETRMVNPTLNNIQTFENDGVPNNSSTSNMDPLAPGNRLSNPSNETSLKETGETAAKPSFAAVTAPKYVRKPDIIAHRYNRFQPERTGDTYTITIPMDFYEQQVQNFKHAVIARLLLRKGDKPRSTEDLKQELQLLWNVKGQWTLIPMGKGFFTLKFSTSEDKVAAKRHAVWDLSRGSIRIREWIRNFDPYKEVSSLCQVWVRIYNLPVEYWHAEVISAIGRTLGSPIRIDSLSAHGEKGNFARILVELDLAIPLQESVTIDCGIASFYVEFVYERLPLYCSQCRLTGHTVEKCKKLLARQENKIAEEAKGKQVDNAETVGDGFTTVKNKKSWKPRYEGEASGLG